jgi:hypothetical protein
METILLRTKAGIEDCARHLESSDAFGTEIESYLTQYLLVVLCADIQQEIYRLSEERASVAEDTALSSYVSSTARKVLRSVRKDEIATFVGMFGVESKKKLNSLIDDAEVTIFNNAVSNRHDVAHKHGSQITFQELRSAVLIAEKLLNAVDQCLIKASSIAAPLASSNTPDLRQTLLSKPSPDETGYGLSDLDLATRL